MDAKSTTGNVWGVTKFLTGLLWYSSKFVVKNTLTVLGVVAWEVKKEVSNAIVDGIYEVRKEQKQLALEKKLLQLQAPRTKE